MYLVIATILLLLTNQIHAQCNYAGVINDNGTCIPCPPGTTASSTDDTCEGCPFGQVAPSRQSTFCIACGENSSPDATYTFCVCDAGYYLDDFDNSDESRTTCIPCPEGAECSSPGTVKSTMVPQKGYWRPNVHSLNFYQCFFSLQCQGGYESKCYRNFDGPLCSNCASNFYRIGVTCYECPLSTAELSVKFFLFIVIVLASFIFLLHSVNYTVIDRFKLAQTRDLIEKPDDYAKFVSKQDAQRKITSTGVTPRPTPTMVKVKLLILDYQVIAKMTTLWTREWPPAFTRVTQFLDLLNLDLITTSGIACIVEERITFYDRLLWALLLPMILYACIIIFYVLPKFFFTPVASTASTLSAKQHQQRIRMKTIRILLFAAYFLYIPTTSTIFMIYNCVTVDDTSYLYLDLNAHCFNKEWKDWNWAAGIIGGVMVFGFPLFCQFITKRMHDHDFALSVSYNSCGLNEPETRIKFDAIYGAYKHDAIWVDQIELYTRWVLVAMVPLMPQSFQALAGVIIAGLFVVFILYVRPYASPIIDRLHLLSYSNLVLISIASLVYARIQNTAETLFINNESDQTVVSDIVVLDIVLLIMLSSVTITFWIHEIHNFGVMGFILNIGVYLPYVGEYLKAVIGNMETAQSENTEEYSFDPLMDANFLTRKQQIAAQWPRLERLGILEDKFMRKLKQSGVVSDTPLEVWNINPLHPDYANYVREQSRNTTVDLAVTKAL